MTANNLVVYKNSWDVGDYISDETDLPLDGDDKLKVVWPTLPSEGLVAINYTKRWIVVLATQRTGKNTKHGEELIKIRQHVVVSRQEDKHGIFDPLVAEYERMFETTPGLTVTEV